MESSWVWGKVLLCVPLLALMMSGCSIKQIAMNKLGDALAGGGTVFASDNDPDLIKTATPFCLKLMESVLAESPRHEGLLLATASGFTQYAYAFVQQEADEVAADDFAAATALRRRARSLYLRARDYGLRGLEARYPDFGQAIRLEPEKAVRGKHKTDVPLLYWTAVSWAAAIALAKDDPELVAELPSVETMIDAALDCSSCDTRWFPPSRAQEKRKQVRASALLKDHASLRDKNAVRRTRCPGNPQFR